MPREQIPLRPILVRYKCDSCGIGYPAPTGVMLLGDPPQFPHRCPHCEEEMVFTEKYPTVPYSSEGELLDLDHYVQESY